MRKTLLAAIGLLACTSLVWSQDKAKAKTPKPKKVKTVTPSVWQKGGNISVALSQTGGQNWTPGADKFTLSANGLLYLYANQTKGRFHFDNWADINYGMQNSDAHGIIKNDDKLDVVSRWSREIGKKNDGKRYWRYSLHNNFRTQFTDGYMYSNGERTRVSGFMAPATFLISPGAGYSWANKFYFHISPFTPRWVIVANRPYELAGKYDVMPTREVRIEGGAFVSASINTPLGKHLSIRSRVDAFSDYLNNKPTNVDVFWTNTLYLQVSKHLGVVYNFDLQYDDNTRIFGPLGNRPGTQVKSIFGVGLNAKF
ncbi:MAG: DUF3078 domain-containing protein [Bacteroidetes bacterium]|jgi:hypothetical protein|nr:MAG: DUF3078 domain-containing protein [Bacteroidota bacterium]TAE71055.1 MAG: DUF3078 domain-containing protein [Bacteroidota bacterium]